MFKKSVEKYFSQADVIINGSRPWDIQVHDPRTYRRILMKGSLGFGEAYMDGWWDCERIDQLSERLLSIGMDDQVKTLSGYIVDALATVMNRQSIIRALQVGENHYDLGNDLFERMLDKSMSYSCAYWKDTMTLEEAQQAKMELICRKLELQPGMRVLDIGCGWGSFAEYATKNYGVSVVGITVSREQCNLARQRCARLPVEIKLHDYRKLNEEYDRVVSVGMFEHVGLKNYRTFMEVVHRCLKDGGLLLLQTIGNNKSFVSGDPWIQKYIFPNGMLPSIKQIGESAEALLVMEDWHNLSTDYEKTLLAWHHNFETHWPGLEHTYDQRFYRMWRLYLLSCAGSFRARRTQLWQIVFSKKRSAKYLSVR